MFSFSIKRGNRGHSWAKWGWEKNDDINDARTLTSYNRESKLFNSDAKEKKIRERIGVMLQEVSLMDGLKVKEILHLFKAIIPNPLSMEN